MEENNLTSAEKEVFAGIISAGSSSVDLLLKSLYFNSLENKKNQDQIARSFIRDVL